jgi:hypothetical protein
MHNLSTSDGEIKTEWVSLGDALAVALAKLRAGVKP